MSDVSHVELVCDSARARILPDDGLTVATFSIGGRDILAPDGMLDVGGKQKRRGGIPVLFPQAGALEGTEPNFNLVQHGFARDMPWENLGVSSDQKTAKFRLTASRMTKEKYPFPFEVRANISLEAVALRYDLAVFNPSTAPIFAAPGLHPYFALPADRRSLLVTNVPGFDIGTYRMGTSIVMPPQRVDLDIPGLGRVKMTPGGDFLRQSSRLVIWSDRPDYICFEPWSSGVGDLFRPGRRLDIAAGAESKMSMRIEVALKK